MHIAPPLEIRRSFHDRWALATRFRECTRPREAPRTRRSHPVQADNILPSLPGLPGGVDENFGV
ncbi:hypothetical protein [Desulfolithobacter sp.]